MRYDFEISFGGKSRKKTELKAGDITVFGGKSKNENEFAVKFFRPGKKGSSAMNNLTIGGRNELFIRASDYERLLEIISAVSGLSFLQSRDYCSSFDFVFKWRK